MCCAELEIHEQGCQKPAANRDSQAARGAAVDQESDSSWSLQKSLSIQGHSSQPSVCGEKKQPSFRFDSNIKDDDDEDDGDDDDDDDDDVCFQYIRQLIFVMFT